MLRLGVSTSLCVLTAQALLLAGCGGGEATPSKATFIKQADAICTRMDQVVLRKLHAYVLAHPGGKGPPRKATATIALPEIQKEAEDLGALPAPKGDEKKIKNYVSEIETGVKEAEKDFTRTFTNDHGIFLRVIRFGTKYGFKVCNEPL